MITELRLQLHGERGGLLGATPAPLHSWSCTLFLADCWMKTTLYQAEITILAYLQTEIGFWSPNWGQWEDKFPLSPNLNWPLPHTAAPCPVTSSSMRHSTIEVIPGPPFFHGHYLCPLRNASSTTAGPQLSVHGVSPVPCPQKRSINIC